LPNDDSDRSGDRRHRLGFDCRENKVDRFVEIGMTLSQLKSIWSRCLRGTGAYARKDGRYRAGLQAVEE